jgi:hypothetical protein
VVRLNTDDAIRDAVLALSRPHPSGGRVIERAAVLATGPDAKQILAWVVAHGEPEALAPPVGGRGIHGAREAANDPRNPLRYVLSGDALSTLSG